MQLPLMRSTNLLDGPGEELLLEGQQGHEHLRRRLHLLLRAIQGVQVQGFELLFTLQWINPRFLCPIFPMLHGNSKGLNKLR